VALDAAEAQVEASLRRSGAATTASLERLREECRLQAAALASKDRALHSLRDTLQSARGCRPPAPL